MAKTNPVDPSVPDGGEDPKLGDNRIRELAAAVAEVLGVDHYMGSDGGAGVGYNEDAAGEHEIVTLREQTAPTVEADKGYVYTKVVDDKAELHFKDEDANEIQLTVAGEIKQSSIEGNSAFVPTGGMIPYGGAAAPTGWLLCNGSAVSRTTYADLFTAISTTYGVGDGSTTFNLPDLRGRVPVGLDAANANLAAADTLGETGGEENHTLSSNEMPAHTHDNIRQALSDNNGGSSIAAAQAPNTAQTVTDSTGGGAAHNNLQPFNTVNYIIKT